MLKADYYEVKKWFIDNTQDLCRRYNTWINIYSRNDDGSISEGDYYKVCFEETLNETEKAVYVKLMTGDQVGSCRGWKVWIPKSCINYSV